MRRIVLILSCLLLLASALAGCGGGEKAAPGAAVLKFTAIPDQNTTLLQERFAPMAAHLAEVLGVPVEYVPARDYQASVEMFRNGDVHLAWCGGLTGVQARAAVPGARAIAQGKADPEFYSYVIANAETGLEKSDDFPMGIRDLTFTFGSESSTSGRLMPEHFIRTLGGAAPEDFFTRPFGFSGSHDKTVELVESGRFQAGVVNSKVYDRRVAEGQTDPAVVKVIWETPRFADYNFTAHPALEELFGAGFIDKLQAALVGMDDPRLLSALPREAIIPASNDDFAGVAAVARELGMVR